MRDVDVPRRRINRRVIRLRQPAARRPRVSARYEVLRQALKRTFETQTRTLQDYEPGTAVLKGIGETVIYRATLGGEG